MIWGEYQSFMYNSWAPAMTTPPSLLVLSSRGTSLVPYYGDSGVYLHCSLTANKQNV
jgi:hypothetical protein